MTTENKPEPLKVGDRVRLLRDAPFGWNKGDIAAIRKVDADGGWPTGRGYFFLYEEGDEWERVPAGAPQVRNEPSVPAAWACALRGCLLPSRDGQMGNLCVEHKRHEKDLSMKDMRLSKGDFERVPAPATPAEKPTTLRCYRCGADATVGDFCHSCHKHLSAVADKTDPEKPPAKTQDARKAHVVDRYCGRRADVFGERRWELLCVDCGTDPTLATACKPNPGWRERWEHSRGPRSPGALPPVPVPVPPGPYVPSVTEYDLIPEVSARDTVVRGGR